MSKPRLKKGMQFLTNSCVLMRVSEIDFTKNYPIKTQSFSGGWHCSPVCYNLAGEPNFNLRVSANTFANFKIAEIINPPQELEK